MRFSIILFILIFNAGCNKNVWSNNNSINNTESKLALDLANNKKDSVNVLVEQEIIYIAPQSGSVNLAWYVDSFSFDEAISWNVNTKLTENLLYIPNFHLTVNAI